MKSHRKFQPLSRLPAPGNPGGTPTVHSLRPGEERGKKFPCPWFQKAENSTYQTKKHVCHVCHDQPLQLQPSHICLAPPQNTETLSVSPSEVIKRTQLKESLWKSDLQVGGKPNQTCTSGARAALFHTGTLQGSNEKLLLKEIVGRL